MPRAEVVTFGSRFTGYAAPDFVVADFHNLDAAKAFAEALIIRNGYTHVEIDDAGITITVNDQRETRPKLGPVDEVPDPKADRCDENEAKIAVGGFVVSGGQSAAVL